MIYLVEVCFWGEVIKGFYVEAATESDARSWAATTFPDTIIDRVTTPNPVPARATIHRG